MCIRTFENQIVRPTVLDDASYACLNYAFPDYLERGRAALKQCGLEGREEEYVLATLRRSDPPAGPGRRGCPSGRTS